MALTDNLVSYYKLDEASGNAVDSVGSNTLVNTGTTYTTGKINNGSVFNGSAYLYKTAASNLPTDNFSMSIWKKFSSITATSRCFAGLGRDGSGSCAIFFYTTAVFSGRPFFEMGSGVSRVDSSLAPNMGEWYHFVATGDGTTVKIYVNGALANSASQGGVTIDAGAIVVGGLANGTDTGVDYPDLGDCDEFGVWSRALTSTEVTSLYNSGNGLQYPFITDFNIWTNQIKNSTTWTTQDKNTTEWTEQTKNTTTWTNQAKS